MSQTSKSWALVTLNKDKHKIKHKYTYLSGHHWLVALNFGRVLYTPYEYYFDDEDMEEQRLQILGKFDELTLHAIRLQEMLVYDQHETAYKTIRNRKNKEYNEKHKLRF